VAQKDVDRVIERAVLARSKASATKLAVAVAGEPAPPSCRASAFWKAKPAARVSPAPVVSAPGGMQSVSLSDAGLLLWSGRELTAAERATLARLTGPLVMFLKSVQSSAAGTPAEGAPRAASSIRRPEKGSHP
jgi:hypothetical protein